MSDFGRDNAPDNSHGPSMAVTTATISGVVHSDQEDDQYHHAAALTFFQWVKHEPVAMIVIATILSLAIQRVGLRFESLIIKPLLTKFVNTCDPDSCVVQDDDEVNGSAPDEEATTAEASRYTVSSQNVNTQNSEKLEQGAVPIAKRKKKVQRKFDSSKVEMYSNSVLMVVCITIADLLFNFAIVYLVYRLFVRSGGLPPTYGASHKR